MASNTKVGKGQAKRSEGLEAAIDRAWDDAKNNHGAQSGDTLTIHSIQIVGDNPIRGYIVHVGPPQP
jgi:hypothetical protein